MTIKQTLSDQEFEAWRLRREQLKVWEIAKRMKVTDIRVVLLLERAYDKLGGE